MSGLGEYGVCHSKVFLGFLSFFGFFSLHTLLWVISVVIMKIVKNYFWRQNADACYCAVCYRLGITSGEHRKQQNKLT